MMSAVVGEISQVPVYCVVRTWSHHHSEWWDICRSRTGASGQNVVPILYERYGTVEMNSLRNSFRLKLTLLFKKKKTRLHYQFTWTSFRWERTGQVFLTGGESRRIELWHQLYCPPITRQVFIRFLHHSKCTHVNFHNPTIKANDENDANRAYDV